MKESWGRTPVRSGSRQPAGGNLTGGTPTREGEAPPDTPMGLSCPYGPFGHNPPCGFEKAYLAHGRLARDGRAYAMRQASFPSCLFETVSFKKKEFRTQTFRDKSEFL